MDSFYASVEVAENPALAGKPVIVGGRSSRGVVTAATYEARAFGVKAGMPSSRARTLCPQGVFLPGRRHLYAQYSKRVMDVLGSITPTIEPVSIDEAYLDVAGAVMRLGTPTEVARVLRQRVRKDVGLPASVGIGTSKVVAKIASGKAKPDGIFLVPAGQTLRFLHSLDVGELPGVGLKTGEVLERRGVRKVSDLALIPRGRLSSWLGEAQAHRLLKLAEGRDDRRVGPREREKSISTERTFGHDVTSHEVLERFVLDAAHQCGRRLRNAGLLGWTVTLKLKSSDFKITTRSRTLLAPTDVGRTISKAAMELLEAERLPPGGVRLAGVGVSSLVSEGEGVAQVLDHDPKPRATEAVWDEIRAKFGSGALTPAALLEGDSEES